MKYIIFLFCIFLFNIFISYNNYLEVVDEEIYEVKAKVVNIYDKKDYQIAKLHTENFDFYTSFKKDEDIKKLEDIQIAFISKKISFISYLKGFYAKTIYFDILLSDKSLKDSLYENINTQHKNQKIKELYQALFLAIPISKELRVFCSSYGISHLVALSGFHLAVLSFLIYYILYFPYKFFQDRYFPYRNRKFDLILISLILLFFYLLLTNIVPSLLRAFVMLVFGVFLLRYNIKILSFKMLFFLTFFIISFFPKFLFSLGFWFSILAVFYIFLYVRYFKNFNKYIQLVFFNFWIFFAMNPIIHYFFEITSIKQLVSPFISIVFIVFYPFELISHIFNIGGLLDDYLLYFINSSIDIYKVLTPFWFFCFYLLISFVSIFYKYGFYVLNILMLAYGVWIYL